MGYIISMQLKIFWKEKKYMKKILKKVVSVATVVTMITSLLFVTDTTQTNAYEGDSISLKPWSFYEGCSVANDRMTDGGVYEKVSTSAGEEYSDWKYERNENGYYKTWESTTVADGFTAKISTTGFACGYEDGQIFDNPNYLSASMNNIEVKAGHDYTLYFDAAWYDSDSQKKMTVYVADAYSGESLIKDGDNDSMLIKLSGNNTTFSKDFTVTEGNSISMSFAYGAYLASEEYDMSGTLEISNVRIFDNGVNPDYEESPIPPTTNGNNNQPTYVRIPDFDYDSYKECICNAGDDFTFDVSDLENDWNNYTVKWTKWLEGDNGYINELEGSGATYTVHNVGEKDFSTQVLDENKVYYNAKIYNSDGQEVAEKWFNLYNKAEYVNIKAKDYNHYLNEGDTVTFSIEAYDADGKYVDLIEKGYTIKWYKGDGYIYDYSNKELIKDARGTSYTVDRIESKYLLNYRLYDDTVYCPHYAVEVYKNDKVITRENFEMVNRKTVVKLVNDGITTASLGDKITLIPELRDADNNLINLNDSQYSVEWLKGIGNEKFILLPTTDINYTIDKTKDNDFYYDQNNNKIGNYYYHVIIRRGGEDGDYIAEGNYYLAMDKTTPPTEETSKQPKPTTETPTTASLTTKVTAPAQAKITKINTKKKADKKIKLSLKKIKTAKGYQVAVYTSGKIAKNDKNAKKTLVKKYVKNIKVTLISNKFKNKKKLYVRVRAYVLDGKTKIYGKWSAVKPIKFKK